MALTLLLGAMSAASAADRFYIEAVNIEPGETRQLAFILDNSQDFFGFQADITLPEGLEFVKKEDKVDFKLSGRADASYNAVSNLLANGTLRVGAFSTSHTAISGNSGTLLYANVHASEDFAGGVLAITDILFVTASDTDIELSDFSLQVGTTHNDKVYIPDFTITVGQPETVSIILDNETPFSAFQMDLTLPKGLTIVANSFSLSSTRGSDHTLSVKSFPDGRTRIICMSLSNSVFSGDKGAIISFEVEAERTISEVSQLSLNNNIFSTANAKEYTLPNSETEVTAENNSPEILPTAVKISEENLLLIIGETAQLSAEVYPEDADDKEIVWESSDNSIISVSETGNIEALSAGTAIVKAYSKNYPEIFGECFVTVSINSGVENEVTDNLKVNVSGTTIHFKGLQENNRVSIYSIDGSRLFSGVCKESQLQIEVACKGIYILKIGNKTLKLNL